MNQKRHRSSTTRLLLAAVAVLMASGARAETVLVQRPSGGPGGSGFSDLQPGGRIIELRVRSGGLIDGIGLVYSVGNKRITGPWHGGQGGNFDRFILRDGEFIVSLSGRSGRYVDSLRITTNQGRTKSWGGSGGQYSYSYQAPAGGALVGLWGRSGALIDALGPAFAVKGSALAKGSLEDFAEPPEPSGGAQLDQGKADSTIGKDFPQASSTPGSSAWLREVSSSLGRIVRQLSGSNASYQSYSRKEEAACGQDELCRIWFRQGAIAHVLGAD